MKQVLSLTILAWLAAISPSLATHYQVYLLGGQSNGNGRADAAQLTPPLSGEQTDVRLYYLNDQDNNSVLPEQQWINLAPGSGHGSTLYYPVEFGPEVSFGRAMADAKPTENIAIIKYTYGGSSMSQWATNGARYLTFKSTVQNALAALTTAGDTYVLRGMLWQQGEADTGASAVNYNSNLTDLIARVRTDLNGGVPFPFVIGSLSDNQYSNITDVTSGPGIVRKAQQDVAAADATVGIVITDGPGFPLESDGIHFNDNGQVALGQGHATQMLALEGSATTSLIHHWALDGNAIDTGSTGGHHGTAVGDSSYTTGSGGKFGEAVSLDGLGDHVQIGQASLPASDFSLTAWIYRETAGDYMYVAGTQVTGDSGAFLRVETASGATTANDALFANLLPPATSLRAWGGTIPLNQWTHVAMTVSSTAGLEIFINGTSEGTDATATTHVVSSNFRIGARPDSGGNEFDGLIDDVAVFDGVLTSTQLANVIASGAANFDGVAADTDPPEVLTLVPGDGDLTVATDANLVITFNESVQKGLSGDIVIKKDGGAIFETIPVTDAKVGISGSVVTINPSGTFALNQGYHVQIADGAIKDLAGNAWMGIADTDSSTWNFVTVLAEDSAGTTGIFDENTDATNALDIEIPALSLATFKTSVLAAYNNDLGGVIDWETGVTAVPSATTDPKNYLTSVAATYGAGGGNTLVLNFDRNMALFTNDINGQIGVLSRQGTWHNALVPDGGNTEIGLAYNVAFSGAPVIEIGAAMPSRSTYSLNGVTAVNFRATATFSSSAPSVVDFSVGGTLGTGDTFLHFAAPSGETITSFGVQWISETGGTLLNGQRRPTLDDLGFILAAPPSNTFANWIGGYNVGGQTGIADDPDGDGIDSGVENFFGTAPDASTQGLVAGTVSGNTFKFTHPVNDTPASDLSASYHWSKDLVTFTPGGGTHDDTTVTITRGTPSGGFVNVTAEVSGTSTSKLFIRVEVTQP